LEGFRRPPLQVLGDEALIPERNRASAPPERFTHELTVAQNYYYEPPITPRAADGTFAAGTRFLWVGEAGEFCWVVDEAGVLVVTERAGLAPIPPR